MSYCAIITFAGQVASQPVLDLGECHQWWPCCGRSFQHLLGVQVSLVQDAGEVCGVWYV